MFSDKNFFIPIVCSAVGLSGLCCILCVVMWHTYRTARHRHHTSHQHNCCPPETQPLDHRSSNGCSKKYRNPLFETQKPKEVRANNGGASLESPGEETRPTSTTELLELDIEKYEKSPRTRQVAKDNDCKNHKSSNKQNKEKNINVEISRSKPPHKCEDIYTDRDIIV